MSSEPATEPACAWVTCAGVEAEPGSLFCKLHGRQARQEGTPWRRPGAPIPIRPPISADTQPDPRPNDLATGRAPAARPLQPAAAVCRIDGCTEPPLAKTIASRSNRWRNLCEKHYEVKRLEALGPARRAQLEQVAGAINPPPPAEEPDQNGNISTPEIPPAVWGDGVTRRTPDPAPPETITGDAPMTYAERADRLSELAHALDAAAAAHSAALAAWRAAVAEL